MVARLGKRAARKDTANWNSAAFVRSVQTLLASQARERQLCYCGPRTAEIPGWKPIGPNQTQRSVDGRLLVVETKDGGKSWQKLNTQLPLARTGEAAFAASNSSLLLGEDGRLWFGTGGAESDTSRLYTRSGWNESWVTVNAPMPSSQASGIFAICRGPESDGHNGSGPLVCVGGDYRATETSEITACISHDDGNSWRTIAEQPASFRSAVVSIPADSSQAKGMIAVGPAGTDFSADGDTWQPLSDTGFHCLSVGKTQIFACGSDGRFGRLQ